VERRPARLLLGARPRPLVQQETDVPVVTVLSGKVERRPIFAVPQINVCFALDQ